MPLIGPGREISTVARIPYKLSMVGLIVSVPVTGAGIFFLLMGMGLVNVGPKPNAPLWVIAWVGGSFMIAGGVVLLRMVQHRLRELRNAARPESWRRDHHWEGMEVRDDSGRALNFHAVAILAMTSLLVPLHWAFWPGRHGALEIFDLVPAFVLGVFDLVLLIMAGTLAYKLLQWARYGRSRLILNSLPFFLGKEFGARFSGPKVLAGSSSPSAVLRCVEDKVVSQQVAGGQSKSISSSVIYEESKPLALDSEGGADVHFTLPADAPGTRLGDVPAVYWEVVVKAPLPGVDFESVFLVPVYAPEK